MIFGLKNLFAIFCLFSTPLTLMSMQRTIRSKGFSPAYESAIACTPMHAGFKMASLKATPEKVSSPDKQTTLKSQVSKNSDLKSISEDIFRRIKDQIKKSPCPRDNCYCSARYLIAMVAKEKEEDLRTRDSNLIEVDANGSENFKISEKLLNTEFYGLFTDFLKKNDSNGISQNLLTESVENEHILFYIAPNPWKHAYVIQKVSNGNNTKWRVYQSFFRQFSLAEWLEIEQWKIARQFSPYFTTLFYLYGKDKVLTTPLQVERCMQLIFAMCSRPISGDSLYIRMFKVAQN